MITPQEAEVLANQAVQEFVNKCDCKNTQDVANVLMKLASMCGLAMCAVVGRDEAVDRMQGTTNYIEKAQAGKNWKLERLQ
jgi:hypothetical protein